MGILIFNLPLSLSLHAEESSYSLFKPVPRSDMREMSTDRPDQTESPYTVDAGHWQVELSIYDRMQDTYISGFAETVIESFGESNFKFGLLENLDIQFLTTLRRRETEIVRRYFSGGDGTRTYTSVFQDVGVRLKLNLIGNDGGTVALGLMPFATLPLESVSDEKPFGLIIPLAFNWSPVSVGMMWQGTVVDDPDINWIGTYTLVFGTDIDERIGLYAEGIVDVGFGSSTDGDLTISTGFTYGLTSDLQLDAGFVQDTDRHGEYSYFFGFSARR
jgi:hypothetical protein